MLNSFGQAGGQAASVSTGGGGSAIAGILTSVVGMSAATGNPLALLAALPYFMSLDDPANDAIARRSGANAAMMFGTSFDDPVNDALAKMRGTRAEALKLGRNSAGDIVDKFEEGFIGAARQRPGSEGSDDQLARAIDGLTRKLDEYPHIILEMDGDQLNSKMRRKNAKTERRDSAV